MKKTKILLTVVAMVLICVVSVMGTVAYLSNNSTTVTNTFVAAGGGKLLEDENQFTILEHKVTEGTDGSYKIEDGAETTNAIEYQVMPGMTLPKDPFVNVETKTDAPAYLYIEVVNGLSDVYSYTVDSSNWNELSGFTGPEGGKVYVYKNGTVLTADVTNINVLTNKQVTVDKDANATDLASATLKINGYLAQANVGDNSTPTSVFKACFTYTDTSAEPNA